MTGYIIDFKKIGKRERTLLTAIIMAVAFSIYFQFIYGPLSKKIKRYRFQIEKSETNLDKLSVKSPQIDKQKQNVDLLNIEYKNLEKSISEIEKFLPSKNNISQLLTELTKQARDLSLISVRQKIETGKEYAKIFIELTMNSSYKELINYIRRVESISKFLVVKELVMSESKTKDSSGMPIRIVLSTLLAEAPNRQAIKIKEIEDYIDVSRDIFVSKIKAFPKVYEGDFELQGITYNQKHSTAILDAEVVRIGSQIKGLEVKDIQPETVVLSDGVNEYFLSISRN